MNLIIAEKPSLGRAIADAIPGAASGKDPIIKGDYTITWLYGHLLGLKMPEDYDPALKKWTMDQLPIYFDSWGQKPSDGKEQRLESIGNLLETADMVIHAGDPDDEGQFLVDEILRWFGYTGPVKRLDTANTTREAMQKSLSRLSENHESVGYAAYARSVADLTVGVNLSRYYTLLGGGALLTVGRVQTPTLGLVVSRDMQIESHRKCLYFTVCGNLIIDGKSIPYTLQLDKNDPRLEDGKLLVRSEAENLMQTLANRTFDQIQISEKTEAVPPPLPFNLVKLQTYCGNHFGYSPQTVLDITQTLREKYAAITYNRSDCQYLSSEHFKEAPRTAATVCNNISFTPKQLDTAIRSRAFNDDYITAHFAIIPTDKTLDLTKFSEAERNVYLAICKYYLAQFLPSAKKRTTSLKCPVPASGTLTASSTQWLSEGYRAIFRELTDEGPNTLSSFSPGVYCGTTDEGTIAEKETKPPPRYTKTSLNEDMTRISRYVKDPEIKQLLLEKDRDKRGENGSIGTSSTRSGIIENLIQRGFISEQGKKLISTPLGRELCRILPDELIQPDMTARWWVMQEQIKTDELPYSALPESVLATCREIMSRETAELNRSLLLKHREDAIGRCPVCQADIVEGKLGYGCSAWKQGCKFTIWKNAKSGIFRNITITPNMARRLLNGESIKSRKLYSEKNDTSFSGFFRLNPTAGEYPLQLVAHREVSAAERTIGTCPRCGNAVVEDAYFFQCTGFSEGCSFKLSKSRKSGVFKNIEITASMAKKLLNGKCISSKKLYSSRQNSTFTGWFKISDTDSQYGTDLVLLNYSDVPAEERSVGVCPLCGSPVCEELYSFHCTNSENCSFSFNKHRKSGMFQDVEITPSMARRLLKGETLESKKLYSVKTGQHFAGTFRLRTAPSPYGFGLEPIFESETVIVSNPVGNCPRCGNPVCETASSFSCTSDQCRFRIQKQAKGGIMRNTVISSELASKLLSGESITIDTLYSSKRDANFSGTVCLEDQGADYGADIKFLPAEIIP